MNKVVGFSILTGTVYLGICLVIFPKAGVEVGREAISVCINSVIPSLFPYLVCSGYLAASGFAAMFSRYLSPVMRPLFGVPGSGAIAFVLGTVSGYPIGAVCAADLYSSGECTKTDAEKLIAFCNNSGPIFIMSVVGCGYLQSPYLGRILYISHVMAAVLTGIIMRTYNPKTNYIQKTLPKPLERAAKNNLRIFGGVMDNSVFTILKICGFVIFFTVFAASLPHTPLSPYIHGMMEITGGTKAIAALDMDFEFKMSVISFLIAFSGISVLFQVGAIASKYGLSLKPYVFGKLLQSIFSAVLTKIMVSKLPETVDVFAESAKDYVIPTMQSSFVSAVFMLGFGLVILTAGIKAAQISSGRKK